MPCRTPGCGCGFVSETLNISEVSPGVWQFEQAEFTVITELEQRIEQLEVDLANLQTTVADGLDALSDRFDAARATSGAWGFSGGPTSGTSTLLVGAGSTGLLPPGLLVWTAVASWIQTVENDRFLFTMRREGVGTGGAYSTGPTATASITRAVAFPSPWDHNFDFGLQRILGTGTGSIVNGSRFDWAHFPFA